jgi:hypothetical protein
VSRKWIVAQHAAIVQLLNDAEMRYSDVMTKLLDKALKAVRSLPSASQDEIARAMLELANESEPEPIEPAHLASVLEGLQQIKAGKYASAADVEAAFRHFDE